MKSMQTVSFEEWMQDLRHIAAKEFGFTHELDAEDWTEFFAAGLSPRDSIIADLNS